MLPNIFLAWGQHRGRLFSYRPAVRLLEDRSLPSFLGPASYAVPGGAGRLAVADFNGDGVPDLATTNYDSGTVSILLGRGDGTRGDAARYDAGVGPGSIVVGDFNGDGILDLAVTNFSYTGTNTVSILLRNGDGSFRPPTSYACGARPVGLVTGDFNGDGVPDLAVAGANAISVLLGRGDGTFAPPLNYLGGNGPDPLVVGDFNGDGLPDLLARNYGGLIVLFNAGDWGSGAPAVRPGSRARRGTHTFPQPAAWSIGRLAIPSAAGDPQALLPGSAIVRDTHVDPRAPAPGTPNTDRPIPLHTVSSLPANLARRTFEDIGFLGWDDAVIEGLALNVGSRRPEPF
jgi:hypothetical protein